MATSFVPPEYREKAFNCPHCGARAQQTWTIIDFSSEEEVVTPSLIERMPIPTLSTATCFVCHRFSLWLYGEMLWPDASGVPAPNSDLSSDIVLDYNEAASIVTRSPRGAAALLRLCIQKLCAQLELPGKGLNADIAELVRRGLPPPIQQALDVVRVIGNEAVHPGVLDLRDDQSTALKMFPLINLIAQTLITTPRETKTLFESLPKPKLEDIKRRDSTPP